MIPIDNRAMCRCIKEYIFNRTETFAGVSKSRFAEHFELIEKDKNHGTGI